MFTLSVENTCDVHCFVHVQVAKSAPDGLRLSEPLAETPLNPDIVHKMRVKLVEEVGRAAEAYF